MEYLSNKPFEAAKNLAIEKSEFGVEGAKNYFAPRIQAEFCHRQKVKMQIPKEERRIS